MPFDAKEKKDHLLSAVVFLEVNSYIYILISLQRLRSNEVIKYVSQAREQLHKKNRANPEEDFSYAQWHSSLECFYSFIIATYDDSIRSFM